MNGVPYGRVLVVDDDADLRALLEVRLRRAGFDVVTAANGEDALTVAHTTEPDVVVLDVSMPGMDGYEVIRRLGVGVPDAPAVIFLTAQTHTAARVTGLELGAADFVIKPFDGAELVARVRAAMRTKRLLDELATGAAVDPLTGLLNRGRLSEQAREAAAVAARHGRPLACLMIDLDRFKQVNDTFGHGVGDEVLRATADAIRSVTRTSDVAGRYGGDEFVLLLPETDRYGAASLAERLHTAIRQWPATPVRITVTIGIACWAAGMRDANDLIAAADAALYEGKHHGRGRTAVRTAS